MWEEEPGKKLSGSDPGDSADPLPIQPEFIGQVIIRTQTPVCRAIAQAFKRWRFLRQIHLPLASLTKPPNLRPPYGPAVQDSHRR